MNDFWFSNLNSSDRRILYKRKHLKFFKIYGNQSDKNLKENVDDYIYENQDIRCSRLDWWKNVMFKYLRCDEHILLYSKFLQNDQYEYRENSKMTRYMQWMNKKRTFITN